MKGRKAMNWKKKLLALGLSLTLTLDVYKRQLQDSPLKYQKKEKL